MLKNKVVLVTGAASGIGRAIALTAAREGALLVLSDIDADAGVETGAMVRSQGGESLFVAADVGSADECQALVSQAMAHFGRLDVACNNAGIGGAAAPLADYPLDAWAQVINIKVEDYIEAARAVGCSPLRIATFHILPNITAPVIVQSTLTIASAIIAEASLSFLGLGQQPPEPSWGSMLNTAKNFMDNAPWMAIWPGLAIFVLVLAFNLLGDGLRDALDPRHR